MADSETGTREAAAELRITRVRALDNQALVAVVTYLLARHPDSFPAMLDVALSSSASPMNSRQPSAASSPTFRLRPFNSKRPRER